MDGLVNAGVFAWPGCAGGAIVCSDLGVKLTLRL